MPPPLLNHCKSHSPLYLFSSTPWEIYKYSSISLKLHKVWKQMLIHVSSIQSFPCPPWLFGDKISKNSFHSKKLHDILILFEQINVSNLTSLLSASDICFLLLLEYVWITRLSPMFRLSVDSKSSLPNRNNPSRE